MFCRSVCLFSGYIIDVLLYYSCVVFLLKEYNEGLHWQEERDLCRALYASLNPHQTKDRCGFDLSENGDSEVTDSGEMASCLEEDSLESSAFQQSSSASDVNESESTDQEKKEEVSFNHGEIRKYFRYFVLLHQPIE